MRRVLAFTLIEMLVVIAIIAILTAIIVPVYSRAKDSALRSDDMASMNQLRSALQLYLTDQGGYPPQLLGYVTLYTSGPMAGNVIPANDLKSYLFPKRVGSLNTFQPAYNRFAPLDTTLGYYPTQDSRAVGSAPVMDLDGDGDVDGADDLPFARQAFGPPAAGYDYANDPSGVAMCLGGGIACPPANKALFYNVSGYDVAFVPDGADSNRPELRYTLFWTGYAFDLDGDGVRGSSFDDPRQMGYDSPPDDTIITWNSYFRNYQNNGVPLQQNREILLFVGGSAKPADANGVYNRSWRYEVNP
ncbi:MAG: type II secretion system protein [Fimbriimonadaceae bacterium]